MNQSTLLQGEPWMTQEEQDLNRNFMKETIARLASQGVPESPLVMLRVNDVMATWFLARRLETALAPQPGDPAPCPTPAQAGAIGKCRDRLRRALKDLEACLPDEGAPASDGFVAEMLQIAEQLAGAAPRQTQSDPTPPQTPSSAGDGTPAGAANHNIIYASTNSNTVPMATRDHPAPLRPVANPDALVHTPTESRPTIPTATSKRQHRPNKKGRKKRGIPTRPIGTCRGTIPGTDPHGHPANTPSTEHGSPPQRGGMSRPG